MSNDNCATIDRTQLTWDWNNQKTIQVGEYALVKPAGMHNNIQVVGTPESIRIFSNGGIQDRTGHTVLVGDYGSDIQWVELCAPVVVTPPVTEEPEIPVKPEPVFQWIAGEPVIDCELDTVTIVMHEEAAGYYFGNDSQWYLGGFFPTGETNVKSISANDEECPVVIPEEEIPVDEVPVETPVTLEETVTVAEIPISVSEQPQLAVTGGVDILTPLFLGAALVASGIGLIIRKAVKP